MFSNWQVILDPASVNVHTSTSDVEMSPETSQPTPPSATLVSNIKIQNSPQSDIQGKLFSNHEFSTVLYILHIYL